MEERYQNKEKVEEGEDMEVKEIEEKAMKRKRDEREKEKEKEEEGKDGESEKKKLKQTHLTTPSRTETFTITLGDSAENHVGMQKLGTMAAEGFSLADLQKAKAWFEERGVEVTIHHLNTALPEDARDEAAQAYVLVAKNGLKAMMDPNAFHAEQAALEKDTKALMYGRVVQKHARHNLCFGEQGQAPNYEGGKGRVVAFDSVPLLKKLRAVLPEVIGEKGRGLLAEGNYYYDVSKCGIGFHGDAERRKVIAVRTGATIPLHYQWFLQTKPVGERVVLSLGHGDMYVMSEKAAGTDFKKKTVYTLRHAAGAKKFLTIKNK